MAAILGAVGGAVFTGGANVYLEWRKARRELIGIGSAIAGEISAIMQGLNIRNYQPRLRERLRDLKADSAPGSHGFSFNENTETNPIWTAYIDRIGLLGGRLPQRVTHFYNLYQSAIIEFQDFCKPTLPVTEGEQIERILAIWQEAGRDVQPLVRDLLSLSYPAKNICDARLWLQGHRMTPAMAGWRHGSGLGRGE